MILRIKDLSVTKGEKKILSDIRLTLKPGELMAVLGLNGAGKTTLYKSILQIEDYEGAITIHNEDLKSLSDKRRGQVISYIPQQLSYPLGMTVEQFVLTGITPYLKAFQTPCKKHYDMVLEALNYFDIEFFRDRDINSLSGGEKQMVLMSRAIVQGTSIMLLDEPCSQLDYAASYRFLKKAKGFIKQRNMSAMITIHDPNLAFCFADKVIILHDSKILSRVNFKKENYIDTFLDGLNTIYNNQIELTKHGDKHILTIVDKEDIA